VAVVTVNYNTVHLIGLLLWSLHTRLAPGLLTEIVVVDNASEDGSLELLRAAAEAGLCRLVVKETNVHHGPGLNQGLDVLADLAGDGGTSPRWVRVLDSDCVVVRPEVLTEVVGRSERLGAAVVGEPEWDRWQGVSRYGTHCLLLDPAVTWRDPIEAFEPGGGPSIRLLRSCRAAGRTLMDFAFLADGYIIHRGRSSLIGVVQRSEHTHPLFEWALEHHEPHFGGVAGAQDRYRALVSEFDADGAPSERSRS